jgi:O-antigen/teichoic acid export membrane protein
MRGPLNRVYVGSIAVTFVNLGLGVLTGVLTARGLEPHDRGALLTLLLWTGVLSIFSMIGLDDALVFHANGEPQRAARLQRALTPQAMVQGGVATAILLAVTVFAVARHGPQLVLPSVIVVGNVWLSNLTRLRTAHLRAAQRFMAWNAVRLLPQLGFAPTVLVLALSGHLTVASAVVAYTAANLITTVSAFMLAPSQPGDPGPLRPVRRYGRRAFAATAPMFANQRLDQLLLGTFFAPQYLGVYAVAVSIAQIIATLGTTMEQILFPRLMSGRTSSAGVSRVLLQAGLGAAGVAAVLAIPGEFLIRLVYGEPYVGAAVPLMILASGAVVLVMTNVLAAEAKSQDRLSDLIRAQVVGVVMTSAALPGLTPYFGITGAAVASAVSYATTFVVLLLKRPYGTR